MLTVEEVPMSNDRLKTLRAKLEAYRADHAALVRAYEAKASGFELARLGKAVKKTMQEFSDFVASITGEPPLKFEPPPLGEALVPNKKPTDE
jgi:hypothetical protein